MHGCSAEDLNTMTFFKLTWIFCTFKLMQLLLSGSKQMLNDYKYFFFCFCWSVSLKTFSTYLMMLKKYLKNIFEKYSKAVYFVKQNNEHSTSILVWNKPLLNVLLHRRMKVRYNVWFSIKKSEICFETHELTIKFNYNAENLWTFLRVADQDQKVFLVPEQHLIADK